MQLIEGQMFVCLKKKKREDKIKLEYRVLELEGHIKMEEMCF